MVVLAVNYLMIGAPSVWMVGHGVKWGKEAEKYHLREGIDDNSIIRFGHTCNLYKN